MTANEVNGRVAEAIEFLRRARLGSAPAIERGAAREKGNEILGTIPKSCWKKVSDELLTILTSLT